LKNFAIFWADDARIWPMLHNRFRFAMPKEKKVRPPQHQRRQPGRQYKMRPQPKTGASDYQGSGKLRDRIALITGGDSGIGRAVSVLYSKEGADVSVVYLNEHKDARETKRLVEAQGRKCLLIAGDIGQEKFCRSAVAETKRELGTIDILVNNAAEQHPQESITKITERQLEKTFRTNIFAMFFLTKAVMPHFKKGGVIINSASVTAYQGSPKLLDYSATKGAIVAFTRSLSQALANKKIRVNAVAPGPIWTPLIPSTFPAKEVATFGSDTPLGRAGEPEEVAPSFVFLASDDSRYMTGQVLHPNGGRIVNG
jgi:NAD(P)-dependent dehydrogenase (short-subunit alcohol dehydrogenase family)